MSSLAQRFGLIPDPAGENLYHGFISYSHAADGQLAPALQRGLQRFAKPWYRMRALHVFRDEAALSANPDLWHSVTAALDASQHYILLASPRAAASEWVGKEASYWCQHKSPDTILIALTDGELSFGGASVPPDQDALPPPLREAFDEEPRYIDLRWAQAAGEVLNLSHPRFREAVAELAAPLHGKPKEELSGEEVRQHRRTVRVARSAAGMLVTLLAAAIVAALIAYGQYRSAQSRSLAAQATADLTSDPQHSLSLALQSTQINTGGPGEQALRLALAQAPLRMTIDSGAGNGAHVSWNPAGNQLAISGPHDTVALWDPLTGKLQRVLRGPPAPTPSLFSGNGPLSYSPDGQWIAYVDGNGDASVWNAVTGAAAPRAGLAGALRAARVPGLHGNPGPPSVVWRRNSGDQLMVWGPALHRVLAFTPSSGAVAPLVDLPGAADLVVPSPDGSKLLVGYVAANGQHPGVILDLSTRSSKLLTPNIGAYGFSGHEACWTPDGATVVAWAPTEAQDLVLRTFNTRTGKQTQAVPLSSTVSAAVCGGSAKQPWLATGDYSGQAVLRVAGGLDYGLNGHSQIINAEAGSPDGAYLATASNDGTARVWNGTTGDFVRLLPDGSPLNSVGFAPGSGLAVTTDQRGLVKIWDTGLGQPSTPFAGAGSGNAYPLGFAKQGALVWGLRVSPAADGKSLASADLVTWSSGSGQLVGRVRLPAGIGAAQVQCAHWMQLVEFCRLTPPPSLQTPVPLATQAHLPLTSQTSLPVAVAVNADAARIAYAEPGAVTVVDPSGRTVARVPVTSPVAGVEFAHRADVLLVMTNKALWLWKPGAVRAIELPQASPPIDAQLSADGSTVAAAQTGGAVGVWSTRSGRQLALLHPSAKIRVQYSGPIPIPMRVALTPDGSTVAAGTLWQTISLWNVASQRLIAVRAVSTPRDFQVGGFGGGGPWPIAELAFSADGTRLVAVDFPQIGAGDSQPPGTATVFDSASGAVLAGFQSPGRNGAATNPGVGLSPSGRFLFGGVLGFAPTPPGGSQAAYQVGAEGILALNLQNAGLTPLSSSFNAPVPADPWSPDGVDLLAGSRGIYTCDACGSIGQLQDAAARRAAWAHPLSVAHDTPPSVSPYR